MWGADTWGVPARSQDLGARWAGDGALGRRAAASPPKPGAPAPRAGILLGVSDPEPAPRSAPGAGLGALLGAAYPTPPSPVPISRSGFRPGPRGFPWAAAGGARTGSGRGAVGGPRLTRDEAGLTGPGEEGETRPCGGPQREGLRSVAPPPSAGPGTRLERSGPPPFGLCWEETSGDTSVVLGPPVPSAGVSPLIHPRLGPRGDHLPSPRRDPWGRLPSSGGGGGGSGRHQDMREGARRGAATPDTRRGSAQKLPGIYFLNILFKQFFSYHIIKSTFLFWCAVLCFTASGRPSPPTPPLATVRGHTARPRAPWHPVACPASARFFLCECRVGGGRWHAALDTGSSHRGNASGSLGRQ